MVHSLTSSSHAAERPPASYPEIFVAESDLADFKAGFSHLTPSEVTHKTAHLTSAITRWQNTAKSLDPELTSLHLAFQSLYSRVHLFHIIESRRAAREMTSNALSILTRPPKSRRPPDVIKLLAFHNSLLHNMKDLAGFKVFNNVPKRSLQSLYKHLVIRQGILPNTPVFVQGHAGSVGRASYFILLQGSVAFFRAGEKRVKEIGRSVGNVALNDEPATAPSSWVGSRDFTSGFLGKPVSTITVAAKAVPIGFGGVQMQDNGGLWDCSCVTSKDCEIIVCAAEDYKACLYADHREKYLLQRRITALRSMTAFKLLKDTQIEHLAGDFTENRFVTRTTIVSRGDAFDRVVVVMSGEVCINAVVADPMMPIDASTGQERLMEVNVVTVGAGSIIGDYERVHGNPIFTYHITALTDVTVSEMPVHLFDKNVYLNPHTRDTRALIEKAVGTKEEFHTKRIGGEMRKYAAMVCTILDQRRRQNPNYGGPTEKLIFVKGEWEKAYSDYCKKNGVFMTVKPHYDVIHDDLQLHRDSTSRQGFRVKPRFEKTPITNSDFLKSAKLAVKPPPVYVDSHSGMRIGSAAGGSRVDVKDAFSVDEREASVSPSRTRRPNTAA